VTKTTDSYIQYMDFQQDSYWGSNIQGPGC